MAKKTEAKKKKRRSNGFTLPVAVIAGFMPLTYGAIADWDRYGWKGAVAGISARMTGYNPQVNTFNIPTMKEGLLPILLGGIIHKFVGTRLGVNRMLGSSGLPIIRV